MEWKNTDQTLTTNFMRGLVGDVRARLEKLLQDAIDSGVDTRDAHGGASIALAVTLASIEQALVEDWFRQEGHEGASVCLHAIKVGADHGEESFKSAGLSMMDWLATYAREGGMELAYRPRSQEERNSKGDPVFIQGPKEPQ